MDREIERAGIPTAHICTMTPIAMMVGSNRIIRGGGVVHPVGDAELNPRMERALRRRIVEKALEALKTEVQESELFIPQP